mgnify:CR=1 FL=1
MAPTMEEVMLKLLEQQIRANEQQKRANELLESLSTGLHGGSRPVRQARAGIWGLRSGRRTRHFEPCRRAAR